MLLSTVSSASLLLLLVAAAAASIAVNEDVHRTALHQCKLDDTECWMNYLKSSIERKLKIGKNGVPCKLDDSDCLKNFFQNEIIGKFSDGFPGFGVKSIDPLHYDKLSMVYEVGIGTKFNLTHINPILYGLAKTKVDNVLTKTSGSKFTIEAQVTTPKILYEGSYTCKGEWFLWPFSWKGKFNITLGDVTDTWKISADVVDRGDESYLQLTDIYFSPKVSTYHAYATGLYGNEEVGKFALEMTNKYWQNFFDVMWRLVSPHVFSKATDEIEAVFAKMPIAGMTSE